MSSTLVQTANTLVNPTSKIIEADCGTLLGSVVTPIDYTLVGSIELANSTPINTYRVAQLLNGGISPVPYIRVRTLSTCVSHGGVCALCYASAYGVDPVLLDGSWTLNGASPLTGSQLLPTGTVVNLPSLYVFATDIIVGDGISTTYNVSYTSAQYVATSYNPILNPEVVSLTDTSITFSSVRQPSDIFVLHYYIESSDPFLEYIAKSYSGSLLGIAPLSSYPLLLRPSVYQTMFSDSQIAVMKNELTIYAPTIPTGMLDYCDTIRDPLEKVLFILYLYAIFANIS